MASASSWICFFDILVLAARDDHMSISCCSNALLALARLLTLLLLLLILIFSRRGGRSGLRSGDREFVGESICVKKNSCSPTSQIHFRKDTAEMCVDILIFAQ
jgi:hypothetical protein